MSKLINELAYYNNLFPNPDIPVSEQAITIKWSERKCYLFKYFITNLTKSELELLSNLNEEADYEIIGAICVYNPNIRIKILEQLSRVEQSDSPFEEIQMIINENSAPKPLLLVKNKFWIAVTNYLKEREYDEYPFNNKARGMLYSVYKIGYSNLNTNQLNYLHGLIESDRSRPKTDHFFVNDYLIQKGFKDDCSLIQKEWANR